MIENGMKIHNIVKIKDLYFVWDEKKQRPLTYGLKKYELISWLETNEGEFGLLLKDKRLYQLETIGLSIPNNNILSLDTFLSNNKAGKNNESLSQTEIYNLYTYAYIYEVLKSENNSSFIDKNSYQLPSSISLSSKYYFFYLLATVLLLVFYSNEHNSLVEHYLEMYSININKVNMGIFTLLGVFFGILLAPRLYLWKYKS